MRVVIAEDSVLLRQGLVHLLTDAGLEVVAAVEDADELLAGCRRATAGPLRRRHPDASDAHRRGGPRRLVIRAQHPEVGVLMLSQYVEERYATDLIARTPGASATC